MDDLKMDDLLTIQDVDDKKDSNSSSITEQTPQQIRESGENGRGVLEVRFSYYFEAILITSVAIHQSRRNCQFRVYTPSSMGSCWIIVSIQFTEWRSSFVGLRKHCSWAGVNGNRNLIG
jgi:hypothetical protein